MDVRIPVIDLSDFGLGTGKKIEDNDLAFSVATDLVSALEKFGLVHLINHGLQCNEMEGLFEVIERFFNQPVDRKMQYKRSNTGMSGWMDLNMFRMDPNKPGDVHESFSLWKHEQKPWEVDDPAVPEFSSSIQQINDALEELSSRLLRLLNIGMHLPDKDFFLKHHTFAQKNNPSYTRINYFPPLIHHKVLSDQQRFGEHSDGSTFTLLFNNNVAGYQFKTANGEFVSVIPEPGAIMVNAGDMIQRWTTDRIPSPVHRVFIPTEEKDLGTRMSVVYFVIPDADTLVECLDGSTKYPPIYPMEYNFAKFGKAADVNSPVLDLYK